MLFRVILNELLLAMKKPSIAKIFQAPSFYELNTLLMRVGKDNWTIKIKIIKCIDFRVESEIKENI